MLSVAAFLHGSWNLDGVLSPAAVASGLDPMGSSLVLGSDMCPAVVRLHSYPVLWWWWCWHRTGQSSWNAGWSGSLSRLFPLPRLFVSPGSLLVQSPARSPSLPFSPASIPEPGAADAAPASSLSKEGRARAAAARSPRPRPARSSHLCSFLRILTARLPGGSTAIRGAGCSTSRPCTAHTHIHAYAHPPSPPPVALTTFTDRAPSPQCRDRQQRDLLPAGSTFPFRHDAPHRRPANEGRRHCRCRSSSQARIGAPSRRAGIAGRACCTLVSLHCRARLRLPSDGCCRALCAGVGGRKVNDNNNASSTVLATKHRRGVCPVRRGGTSQAAPTIGAPGPEGCASHRGGARRAGVSVLRERCWRERPALHSAAWQIAVHCQSRSISC